MERLVLLQLVLGDHILLFQVLQVLQVPKSVVNIIRNFSFITGFREFPMIYVLLIDPTTVGNFGK